MFFTFNHQLKFMYDCRYLKNQSTYRQVIYIIFSIIIYNKYLFYVLDKEILRVLGHP